MFYEPLTPKSHGLPHDPFKAIVAPRPIGWIATVSAEGSHNLAPYSYFQAISDNPHMVMFVSAGWKHSATNARDTGEFVVSYVSRKLCEKMNETSVDAPDGVSEAEYCGIEMAKCNTVGAMRVAEAPASLECRVTDILEPRALDGSPSGRVVVMGQVTGIHIEDNCIRDGRFDVGLAEPVTRLGYMDYDGPDGLFEMFRPIWKS